VLTWIGCAVAPDPIGLNEVLPLPDGGFIGTDFLARGDANARTRMSAGEVNGALWEWHTGKGWKKIPGTEASGANGLEISKDGKTLYVAGWEPVVFQRIAWTTPCKTQRHQTPVRPDNVRWALDGELLVTGQREQPNATTNIVKVDPKTLKVTSSYRYQYARVRIGNRDRAGWQELWVVSYRATIG
jgi:hypothetical protein